MSPLTPPPPDTVASKQGGTPPTGQQDRPSSSLGRVLILHFLTQGLLMEGWPEPWMGIDASSLPGKPLWIPWTSPSHPSAQPGLGGLWEITLIPLPATPTPTHHAREI